MTADDGSIYIHIDAKMEHHVRLLMDKVFGPKNFRNSITRIKCNPKNFNRYSYGNIKDTILFYSMNPNRIKWHPQEEPLTDEDAATRYPLVDEHGRRYATTPLHAPGMTRNGPTGGLWRGMTPPAGRHWRYTPDKLDELDAQRLIAWSSKGNPRKIIYADESLGKLPQDVWEYKDPQRPNYPTQKNAAMLERIILTSSEPGDTVLDCYAGSGTTLLEAARLGRRFIGMDDAPAALQVIKGLLKEQEIKFSMLPARYDDLPDEYPGRPLATNLRTATERRGKRLRRIRLNRIGKSRGSFRRSRPKTRPSAAKTGNYCAVT